MKRTLNRIYDLQQQNPGIFFKPTDVPHYFRIMKQRAKGTVATAGPDHAGWESADREHAGREHAGWDVRRPGTRRPGTRRPGTRRL